MERSAMSTRRDWICCQLGAREHYAVPRALHRRGLLRTMITDAWIRPASPLNHLPVDVVRRLAERTHPDLASADIRALTLSLLTQEVEWRLRRRNGWDLLMARNEWFQSGAVKILSELAAGSGDRPIVFAHSYAALAPFKFAKAKGWTTVLGQIDPGEEHFKIVRRLADTSPQYGPAPEGPPIAYFEQWRNECSLADHIVVNSPWSREAVIRAGADGEKVQVLPLAVEYDRDLVTAPHVYPQRFTAERPLRLLFVGSVSVIKGAPELLEAMGLLRGLPVTLTLVGDRDMHIPMGMEQLPSVHLKGAIPRGEVDAYYKSHDVLVFPSHSDGFGMAQIEAHAAGLPIVASSHCGQVVVHGESGLVLGEVTAEAIAGAVRALVDRPARLAAYSRTALAGSAPGLAGLGAGLARLINE
jgi:glycosyltransferase involved in cell wall biosynthesis